MSNVTLQGDTEEIIPNSALDSLRTTWDSFSSTSAYRIFLFTGAVFSSSKARDFIGAPVCIGIVVLAFAVGAYESKFNYLVDVVTPKRQVALRSLRKAKTEQLSSARSSSDEDFQTLISQYEENLREELKARVIIPGVWVIEMDPEQEDRSAAPQLLGLEISDDYTLEPITKE